MNAGIFVAELCIIPENVSSREANQHGGIIMAIIDFRDSIVRLREQLEKNGYSKSRIKQFNRTTNQLIEFMSINGIREYSLDVGLRFLDEKYGVKIEDSLSKTNRVRMLDLNMLSEFQLHGMYTVRHRNRNYHIPEPFHPSSLYRIVSGYIHKAGLTVPGKKRGPHSLCHSLASRLLEENVPLPVISEILGHATTETTAVYLTIGIDKLRRCALEV